MYGQIQLLWAYLKEPACGTNWVVVPLSANLKYISSPEASTDPEALRS